MEAPIWNPMSYRTIVGDVWGVHLLLGCYIIMTDYSYTYSRISRIKSYIYPIYHNYRRIGT